MRTMQYSKWVAVVGLGAALSACGKSRNDGSAAPSETAASVESLDQTDGSERAELELQAAEGVQVAGRATFTPEPDGVLIMLDIDAAPPGNKGVHVHEKGDCSDIKGGSMGSHFAPEGNEHALPSEGNTRHLGDLGNITIDSSGKGRLEIKLMNANLRVGDPNSLLGRSLVVHSGEDNGKAQQPAGGSGDPMACGVIRAG